MRILHTSDWHLGRLFHEVHLTDDQAHVLDQVIACVRHSRPDVIVVAGDVYDRAVPPTDAVSLLDEVLSRLVLETGVRVIVTAGNHDSPDRLGFASAIMENRGLHIAARLPETIRPVVIEDRHGPVYFFPVPYAEPARVRECLGLETMPDHNSAMNALVEGIRKSRPQGVRSVLVAHAFVAGGRESESERPLSVGGAGTVEAECFAGFDYVALGHLHRPQEVANKTIHYSGSLLKYSFSETDQEKCLKLVEMDAQGACRVEIVPLVPRHDVRAISGCLDELIHNPEAGASREDFLSVTLLDTGAVYEPMGKLRAVYPNVVEIRRPAVTQAGQGPTPRVDHRRVSESELFAGFYHEVTGETLSAEQHEAFVSTVDRLRRQDREAGL
jgi:exonuclease SbcD